MKNDIFKYFNFILPAHNCVTIPDFGGFILNIEPAKILDNGAMIPPFAKISFNQDLNHNDGILASYIMKDEAISYNAACDIIKKQVKGIKKDLYSGKTIQCSSLGEFCISENQIQFKANPFYSTPSQFGLNQMRLSKLIALENPVYINTKKSRTILRQVINISAAAIGLLLLMLPSTNIKDEDTVNQNAGFIHDLTQFSQFSNKKEQVSSEFKIDNNTANINSDTKTPYSGRNYYIIIGGEESKQMADRLLNKIQSSDFPNAQIVESKERHRIYVKSFADKSEAEEYLDIFRRDNTKYSTAWLYSKRN